MSKPQDIFGVAPKTVLNKPLLHAQYQLPNGTDGGSSLLGVNNRLLNVVLHNEIVGSSVNTGTGLITLAAGVYQIEAECKIYNTAGRTQLRKEDGTVLVSGVNSFVYDSAHVGGQFTLTETTNVRLCTLHALAVTTNGLGVKCTLGINEVYVDARINRLDQDTITNKVFNPVNSAIASEPVTGGWFGGGIESHTNTTVTMRAFSVMSDDGLNELVKDSVTVVDLGTPEINTNYYLFAVKLTAGGYGYKTDTDINGANLTGIDAKRWDCFVRTDSIGDIIPITMEGNSLYFNKATKSIFATGLTSTAYTIISLSGFDIGSRLDSFAIGGNSTGSNYFLVTSVDGVNEFCTITTTAAPNDLGPLAWSYYVRGDYINMIPNNGSFYVKVESGANITLKMRVMKLNR